MQDFLLISGLIMVPSIILFAYFRNKKIKNSCGKKQCPAVKDLPPGYVKGRKF